MLYTILVATFVALATSKIASKIQSRYEHEIHGVSHMTSVMKAITEDRVECRLNDMCPQNVPSVVNAVANCNDASGSTGTADGYTCSNINMLAFISLVDLGFSGSSGNDIWGWQSLTSNNFYAIVGTTSGTSFVDVSDPVNPKVIGTLNSNVEPQVTWRDMKIYNNYAYIVADDAKNAHGMQVVNLAALDSGVVDLVTIYTDFGSCHNIVIDEDSGYAYGVGTRTCSGGLHQVDIRDPSNPSFAGCFSSDGYTHDAECVIYSGPDSAYKGHEICMNYNEDTVTLVDVSSKASPIQLSRTPYPNSAYTHQGWMNAAQNKLIFNDELDESRNGFNTRTHIMDVSSLSNAKYEGYFQSPFGVIDHNLYFADYNDNELICMANYEAGLVIYQPSTDYKTMTQVGFFDTYPSGNTRSFNGAWSNFPYFMNQDVGGYKGVILVQDINRGFFVLQYDPSLNQYTTDIPLTPV